MKQFILFILLVISWVFICIPALPEEKFLSDSQCLDRISTKLRSVIGNKKQTVSIFPFTYADGTYSAEGCILADFLLTAVTQIPEINLVERENIDKIIDEIILSSGGYTQQKLINKGKMLSADLFVFGTLEDLGDKLKVFLRIAEAKTGKIILSDSFLMNRRIKDVNNPIWEDIAKIKLSGKSFGIKIWTKKRKIKIGNALKIYFKADRSCYVTVFSLGTSGKLSMLFPNRLHNNNYIKANKEYSIPSTGDRYTIKASGPKGINKIKIFATTKNIPLLLKNSKPSFFREVTGEDIERFRDLEVVLNNTKDNNWAEAQWELILE